jgi:hypothetical protein
MFLLIFVHCLLPLKAWLNVQLLNPFVAHYHMADATATFVPHIFVLHTPAESVLLEVRFLYSAHR